MFDMELFPAGGNVARPQRLITLGANEAQAGKVVALAQGVLSTLAVFNREELLSDNLVTVLHDGQHNVMSVKVSRSPCSGSSPSGRPGAELGQTGHAR